MTQGEPLYPIIFNVVVDAVVQHWVELMVEGTGWQVRREQEGRHQNALFYMYYCMIASSDPGWLQGAFSTLVGLFDKVGLKTSIWKMVGMVCRMSLAEGTHSELVYKRRMMGVGPSYRERHHVRVQCLECREDMLLGSLEVHLHTQNRKAIGGRKIGVPRPPVEKHVPIR